MTLAVIVFFICLNSYENYKKIRKSSKFIVFLAFLLILVSQLAFSLIFFEIESYVIGETLMLIGFFVLLYNYLTVSRE